MTTRVYLPLSTADLQALEAGDALAAGRTAYAVTDHVRSSQPSVADEEELEAYVAGLAAVAGAAAGWGAVVAAADVAEADVDREATDDLGGPAGVMLRQQVGQSDVVAFYVGDDVLGEMADDAAEITLSWYDVSELDEVLRLVGSA